jgi:hypothetical protein
LQPAFYRVGFRTRVVHGSGNLADGLTVLPFLCTNCGSSGFTLPNAVDAPKLAGPDD